MDIPLEPLIACKAIVRIVSSVVAFAGAAAEHQMLTDRRNIGRIYSPP